MRYSASFAFEGEISPSNAVEEQREPPIESSAQQNNSTMDVNHSTRLMEGPQGQMEGLEESQPGIGRMIDHLDQSKEIELLAVSEKAGTAFNQVGTRDKNRPISLKKLSGTRTRFGYFGSDSKRQKSKPQINRLPSLDSDKQKSEQQQTQQLLNKINQPNFESRSNLHQPNNNYNIVAEPELRQPVTFFHKRNESSL